MARDDDTLSLSSSDEEGSSRHSSAKPLAFPIPRTRTALLSSQKTQLMALWNETHFPSSVQRQELSLSIDLPPRKVQVWFQNMRQKTRRAEKDNDSATFGVQPTTSLRSPKSVGSLSASSTPTQRRTPTVRPPPPPRAAVLPSISSFMLSHAPAPTLMLGTAPLWDDSGPSTPSSTTYPPPRDPSKRSASPEGLPSVLQFSRIGPPPEINIEIDPTIAYHRPHLSRTMSHPHAQYDAPRPYQHASRTQSIIGPSDYPFDRSDSSSSSRSASEAGLGWPPAAAQTHYQPPGYGRPPPVAQLVPQVPSETSAEAFRLPSFSDFIHSSGSPATEMQASQSSSGHSWASSTSSRGMAVALEGLAGPVLPPLAGSQPIRPTASCLPTSVDHGYGSRSDPTLPSIASLAAPPSPRSLPARSQALPYEVPHPYHPSPRVLQAPAPMATAVTTTPLDHLVDAALALKDGRDLAQLGERSSPRSASMGDVEVPRYGSYAPAQIPPSHLEVVGVGGRAGLGRWSIAGCGTRR